MIVYAGKQFWNDFNNGDEDDYRVINGTGGVLIKIHHYAN